MRTTIILKDDLLKKAAELTQIRGKTKLVHAGLEALIAKYSRDRLSALGGSEKQVTVPPRRRTNIKS